MDVSVGIGTYGDESWVRLARHRALPSSPVKVFHRHRGTLQEARNACLDTLRTEWVIFLDADDELEPGYVDAMAQGSADIRAPAVRYVPGPDPYVPRVVGHDHACSVDCLDDGNWIVIGACVRAQLIRDVGGWGPEDLYEDWALWRKLVKAGASVEAIPDAVYRAHVRPKSRNTPTRSKRVKWTREIQAA